VAALLAKTLSARCPILRVERPVVRADGGAFPATCATSLLRNPSGTVYGAIVTFSDITEIKVMEQRIQALDRLAALGRFTAGIAHEIRNPLTGIGTGVQYLERHLRDDADQTENLTFIRDEISRLNRIVEDLFRVTHPHPLRKSPENPQALLERAVLALGDLPETKRVAIHLRIDPALEAVTVDPDQMQQVLLNLFKNAVEATPDGGTVDVHAYPSGDEPRPHTVIQVIDSGPGIDPESLPKIFEPFYTKGKANGTGLGLYVSHGIVERHGGELHAANHNQGGAVLTLRLPLDTYELTEML
jgi:two-component system sensor histidine kinase AtoS